MFKFGDTTSLSLHLQPSLTAWIYFNIFCVTLLGLRFNYYHFQVCEQHFHESKIIRTASTLDKKSGKTITCNL